MLVFPWSVPAPTSVPASAPSTQPDDIPQTAHRLYWQGQYAQARESYLRGLTRLGSASQPAKADFARVNEKIKNEVAAGQIGLSEVDYQTGEYSAGIARLLVLGKSLEASKLPADLHRRMVETQVRSLLAVGKYEEALETAQAALQNEDDYAFRYLLGMVYDELNRPTDVLATLQPVFDEFKRRPPKTLDERLWAGQGLYLFCRTRGTLSKRLIEPILQDYFQTAVEGHRRTGVVGDRELWPALLASAQMLFLHYQKEPAAKDASAALRVNSNLPEAYILLAQIDLENWDFEKAEQRLQKSLAINPHNADARTTLAQCRMLERKFDEAVKECDRALAVNPRHVEALALKVAALRRQFKDREAAALLKDVETQWPNDPRVYYVIAEQLSAGRQFPEAIEFYQKAIQLAPKWADPLTGLGMTYMQTGDDQLARQQLEVSNKIDSYNVRTFNTLNLLDYLQGRTTGTDGQLVSRESKHFILRYDRVKDAMMGDYFLDYLEKIYRDVTGSFDMPLAEKTIIELYPSQQKFAVRITGEPWIPTVGACTGRVIALTAPRRSAGAAPYNWTSVLKHEFTHTVTLAATKNRIPHWFTEGLAVLTEDSPREWNWCLQLARALRRGELFTLQTIDWGFARPKKPGSRIMAYAQSEWMCEFIVQRWGYDSLNKMIKLYREGKTQNEVFQTVCRLSESQFDKQFVEWAKGQVKSWGLNPTPVESVAPLLLQLVVEPKNAALYARLAQARLDVGELKQALQVARQALAIKPNEPQALKVAAEVLMTQSVKTKTSAEKQKLEEEAAEMARQLAQADPESPVAPRILAALALHDDDYDVAEAELIRYQQLVPLDPYSYRVLAGIYLDREEPAKALPQLIKLCQADTHDARLPRKVAGLYDRENKLDSAIEWQRRSLQVDPYEASAHFTLGEWLEKKGDKQEARREYRMAATLEPKETEYQQALERLDKESEEN